MNKQTKKLTLASMFLALTLVLPLLTGQIPQIGSALSPMHIPVLLCGFFVGWKYGLAVGFIAPLLRSMIFTMPPMMVAIPMAFELATYGFLSGFLFEKLGKENFQIIISLVIAMFGGRVVWGIVQMVMAGFTGNAFTLQIFFTSVFISAIPGIILHLILIPTLVILFKKYTILDV